MASKLIVLISAILSLAHMAAAAEYPCPSDPGFCYRDIGNDGCFDSGVDEGPINDEIESSMTFNPSPPPGSIICPPSVDRIEGEAGMMLLVTPSGSSIRFYGKPKIRPGLHLMSGGEILFSGRLRVEHDAPGPGIRRSLFQAEDTIRIEGTIRASGFSGKDIARPAFYVESQHGDVIIGPKGTYQVGAVDLLAPMGQVLVLEKVKFFAQGIDANALDSVHMDGVKIRDGLYASGSSVTLVGKTTISEEAVLIADPGDVVIERGRIGGHLWVFGRDVTIGSDPSGAPKPSRLKKRYLRISATGDVRIVALSQTAELETVFAEIETSGTLVELLASKIKGKGPSKDYEIVAGPGSVCDLSGTTFKNVNLLTSCDVVVGP